MHQTIQIVSAVVLALIFSGLVVAAFIRGSKG